MTSLIRRSFFSNKVHGQYCIPEEDESCEDGQDSHGDAVALVFNVVYILVDGPSLADLDTAQDQEKYERHDCVE